MDMSVKLNASYPQVVTQAAATPAAPVATAATATDGKTSTATGKQPERAELDKAVKDMQAFVDSTQRNLQFSIDDTTHQVVVKVIATESGEVVRQIPSETALKLAQSLKEGNSVLFDTQV
ncbi:flagellar protein FlaG [Pseudomonas sp. App30]|uniref:flagellar protein FlaG n=1 Tax=Pseudomonas sp. App30 TaxID=3068990 RepID=UPI003A8034A6